MRKLIKLMLDSGAFSTWRRAEEISLSSYIDYIQEHKHLLHSYVNLDVIPGQFGRTPTSHQVEDAAKDSFANWQAMRQEGLNPLAVYHIGERRYWLEKMLGEGVAYIGLGGLVGADIKRRKAFIDHTFRFLCGIKGYPEVKVHGFGITAPELIQRYPWHSVDSSSWLAPAKTGICPIPHRILQHEGVNAEVEYNFGRRPYQIKFSESKAGKETLGIDSTSVVHYRTLGEGMTKYVHEYLEHAGLDINRVRKEYGYRCRLATHFLKMCRKTHLMAPFRQNMNGFFSHSIEGAHGTSERPKHPTRIFLVVPGGGKKEFRDPALEEKMHYWLISYLTVRSKSSDLEEFVRTGYFKVHKKVKV